MPTSLTSTSLAPYFMAMGANLCFGTASIAFSRFAKSHSATWINQLKVSVALFGFLFGFFLFETYTAQPVNGLSYLLISGFIGLFLGDLFLFKAFASLGAARTLVLYSFQPFLLGIYGYLFLSQSLNNYQLLAILCMIACVITFLFERKRKQGHFDLMSFAFAFLGIAFDAIGIMFSRQAYEVSPSLGSFQANATRALGAMIGFFLIRPSSYAALFQDVKKMKPSDRSLAIGACLLGTFISLSLYLKALKTAHVATLTAISITGPVWVSLIEHIRDRSWPNRYLWLAFFLFLAGFALMTIGLKL
jgi:threonine/homoserine efflux transporter RhtA